MKEIIFEKFGIEYWNNRDAEIECRCQGFEDVADMAFYERQGLVKAVTLLGYDEEEFVKYCVNKKVALRLEK